MAITAQVITYLIALRDAHQNAELMVLDLISTCRAYETAWSRIQQWALQASDELRVGNSETILDQLETFLETGRAVMDLIKKDIDRISSTSKRGGWWRTGTKPRGKDAVQLLLHEKTILDHSNRIHRQNTSLNLLVSVLTLYASRVDYPRHLLTTLDLLSPFKKQRSKFYVPNSVRMKRLHGR